MSVDATLLGMAGPAVALAALAYTVITQRKKASAEALGKIEAKVEAKADVALVSVLVDRVDDVKDRVTKIEDQLEHMPDRETTHRLELSITEMRGEMKTLAERMKPVAAISERLQELMLQEGRGRQ